MQAVVEWFLSQRSVFVDRLIRCFFWSAGWMVLLGFCLQLSPASASTVRLLTRRVQTAEKLQTVGAVRPQAYVHGNNVRLFYTQKGKRLVFSARWKHSPLDGRGYTYRSAELRLDKIPPHFPSPKSHWRDATVLGHAGWDTLAHDTAEELVPRVPDQGIYFQLVELDGVLYRDKTGKLREVSVENKPTNVPVVRRANSQEFAVAMMRVLETKLRARYPGRNLFLLTPRLDPKRTDFILIDLTRKLCVYLNAPMPADDPRGAPRWLPTLQIGGDFVLESNGLALLKNPISAAGRLLNLAGQNLVSLLRVHLPSFSGPIPPVANRPGMNLVRWEHDLDRLTGTHRERGSLRLLIDGEEFFPLFMRRIRQAQHCIHIHVNIFDRDDVAVEIADLLRQRSKSVDVKVLMDLLSSQMAGLTPPGTPMRDGFVPPHSIEHYLRHDSHVKVRSFLNPWFSADHCKVFTIDDRYAYLGGMNIGREYRYEWHDLMVEVQGPVVWDFERDFQRAWAHAGPLGDLAYAVRGLSERRRPPAWARTGVPADSIELRRLYTRTGIMQVRVAVLAAMRRAKRYIYLENAYLYDNSVVAALARARRRGVDVRVVLPSKVDIDGGASSNFLRANYLLKNGVQVYIYPGMSHVKALLVDGWACIGSANFNKLSLCLNQETDIATSDPDFANELRDRLFDVDFSKSHELRRPLVVDWTDHLAASILDQF